MTKKVKETTKKIKKTVKRIYGWKPDLPDNRDLMYGVYGDVQQPIKIVLPSKVDLSPFCSPVEDQSRIGSCTSQAIVGALEILENKNKDVFLDLSRLFLYYNERLIEGTVNQDSGAMIRDGIKALVTYGVCTESKWPYDITKFTNKPTPACYKEALTHTISSYQRLTTLNDMKSCLASGFPFVFGFSVYDYFESQEMATTGILKMPQPTERVLGGHAICAVAYDDSKQAFLIRNSWGSGWGINGYFWMPYEYISNRNLTDDFWTISQIKGF